MNAGVIPADIEKIKDHQYQRFIDVTPSGESRSWKILGIRSCRFFINRL